MLRILLTGVSFAAFATAAMAQPSAPAPEKSQGIEEIVVTAQRREESAQRAALAIQAISSEQLSRAGVAKVEDLRTIATGVQIGAGGAVPQIYIRGVGNYSTNNYSEGAVAINVDGVYVSRGWATHGEFFDLSRVEVLKGPQGTLYGRNASGGAINLITNRPVLNEFGGYVQGEVGNYELRRGEVAINVPIGKDLALRASGEATHRDGYFRDGYLDDKGEAARVQLLYKPSSDFSMLLKGGYQHLGGKGPGMSPIPPLFGTDPWSGLASPQAVAFSNATIQTAAKTDGFIRDEVYTASGELNWNLGFGTLTVIPSYRSGKNYLRTYVPGFQINNAEFDHQTSLETRLSNQTDRLKWVAGLYYFDEHQGNLPNQPISREDDGGGYAESQGPFKSATKSAAAFGQATYSVAPTFRLTAGLRYTYEHKRQDGIVADYVALGGPLAGLTPFPNIPYAASLDPTACAAFGGTYGGTFAPVQSVLGCHYDHAFSGKLDFYNLSYKAGIEYDITPKSMLYASYSTGFKSGGFTYANTPTFKPERLGAWELGVKNRFFHNTLQANVELFYWRYLNHQESHLSAAIADASRPFVTFVTENAGVVRSFGVAVDLAYNPTPQDRFTLAAQYNPTQYRDFKFRVLTAASGSISCPTTGVLFFAGPAGPIPVSEFSCAGRPVTRSPLWSGNAGYDHDFVLSNGGMITAGVSGEFATGSYVALTFQASERQQAWFMLNSDLTYTAPNGKWSLSVWGRNMTNAAVYNEAFELGPIQAGSLRPPTTYGVRGRLNF